MRFFDISQEIFTCAVYPGDPAPAREVLSNMDRGDLYNLTAFSMCAHNGTHVDAPLHFIKDGKAVDELELSRMVGFCFVIEWNGLLGADDARRMVSDTREKNAEAAKRLLFKGSTTVSNEAAGVFAEAGIFLVGNESQTVGPEDAPMKAHHLLLGKEVVLLEGIRLGAVPDGIYLLSAAPISLGGAEGAPCRAILIDLNG